MLDEYDFTRAKRARGPRFQDGFGILIDGATGYSVRLIPSNKVLASAATVRELWPVVLAAIDRGYPPRCLVLDAHLGDGRRAKVSSGRTLVSLARAGIGAQTPNTRRAAS
jgi:hypothetical protein